MAIFRGRAVPSQPSQARLKRLRQLQHQLIARETPGHQDWPVFLDEAGGVELNELGEALSQVPATRRARIADLLIGFLADPDWNRRDSAARILGAMGAQAAIPQLRHLVFQPAEESLARLAALRALERLGGLTPDEITMLRLDPSPLIRAEADRLLMVLRKQKATSEKPVALSNLLQNKQFPTAVFDNLIARDIILSVSRKGQPVRELADQIGRSPTTIRRYLAWLQNKKVKKVARAPVPSGQIPLVAARRKGKTVEYLLTKKGDTLRNFVGRAYSHFLKQKLASAPFPKEAK